MDNLEPEIEAPLRDVIRHGRSVSPLGFTDRALLAVRRDVARRKVIRWSSLGASLAACAALALCLAPSSSQSPSDGDLARLVALHEEVMPAQPRLDDADALASIVLADLEASAGMPRLEGAEESIARIVLGS